MSLFFSRIKQDISISALVAGIMAVIVSYAGSSVIVFQAASMAHLSHEITSSWIWAISMGTGISGLLLSWSLKKPIITAWSTPGAALLVILLPSVSINQAVGAYLFAALIIMLIGFSGLFDKIMHHLPKAIASAMLAGILFKFGTEIFISIKTQPLLVLGMLFTYLVFKRIMPRYTILAVLIIGAISALFLDLLHFVPVSLTPVKPQFIMPQFNLHALVNIGLPLALVTLTGQYITGMSILKAYGYNPPTKPIVGYTGLISFLLAPFGSHGVNLAAITAAMCTSKEAHADKTKRYIAGVTCGILYIIIAIFGATVASIFANFPKELIAALAGLALLGAIASGLSKAMENDLERKPALITFIVTVSGMTLFGLGSAFWGIIFGIIADLIMNKKGTRKLG